MRSITVIWTLGIALVLTFVMPALAKQEEQSDLRTIKVTGEAEIKVVPDKAVIIIGIEKNDMALGIAKKQNDDAVKAAVAAAVKDGIPEGDISSEYFNVEPRYDDSAHKKFLGYFVRRRMVITLKDITKFETLITDLLSSGVEYIQDVQFQTSELRKYRDQARANAIKAAAEKAQAMASELGLKAGKAHSIEETNSNWRSWYGGWYGYGNYGNWNTSQVSMQPPSQSSDENPIALGKISVTATVSASFDLE